MLPTAPFPYSAPVYRQTWPLQLGQPLKEIKYTQQQCKCNNRQIGSEPVASSNAQMQ